jgi:uncharacterized protein YeaO (DUF488 family)
MTGHIHLKRAYEPPAKADGLRVLVDRLWPRGLRKAEAGVDLWLRDLAPSTALRRWFGHRPERWEEFQARYRAELKDNPALKTLREALDQRDVTLLYAARDEVHNNARALAEQLRPGD